MQHARLGLVCAGTSFGLGSRKPHQGIYQCFGYGIRPDLLFFPGSESVKKITDPDPGVRGKNDFLKVFFLDEPKQLKKTRKKIIFPLYPQDPDPILVLSLIQIRIRF